MRVCPPVKRRARQTCACSTRLTLLGRAWEEEINDHERRGLNEIERMTIDKINERTGSAADQLRQTYAIFGRPREGITPECFYSVLRKMGYECAACGAWC